LFLKDAKDQNLLIGLDVLQRSDGSTDHNTLHGGCKVLAGEKWLATKWMRQDVFNEANHLDRWQSPTELD